MENVTITRSIAMNRKTGGAIVGIKGSCLGKILRIQPEAEILLGRDTNICDICFESGKVSRKHCGITYHITNNSYTVCDYSANGTFLGNGQRLDRECSYELPSGTELWIGTKEDVIKLG